MVTAYYISRLSKSKKTEVDDYYQELLQNRPYLKSSDSSISSRCRVCLKPSSVSIFDNENYSDVLEALKSIGDITVEEDDELPKSLCAKCDLFINTAILFKKRAKQSEAALKQHYLKIKKQAAASQRRNLKENGSNIGDGIGDGDWQAEEPTAINYEVNEEKKVHPKVTCRICGKVINKKYYRNHLQLHNPNAHQWVCEVCGKSFKMKSIYHTHRSRHRTDFSYKCTQCPYRGRTKELLKIHMHKHSGDYRYMCTECPARFIFKTNLTTHMFKHKEPQFKCESCKRAFHSKLLLQRHIEADHLGILNHVCNICGKAFGYRKAMMNHQRGVHKRKKMMFGRMPSYLAESRQEEQNESHLNL